MCSDRSWDIGYGTVRKNEAVTVSRNRLPRAGRVMRHALASLCPNELLRRGRGDVPLTPNSSLFCDNSGYIFELYTGRKAG